MKPLRLLQRRIIATNLFFVLILLLGILTALFLNARARSMKEAGRYLAAELRFASFFSEHESEASSSSDEIGPPPDGAQAATAYYPYVVFSRDSSSDYKACCSVSRTAIPVRRKKDRPSAREKTKA